MLYLLDLRNSVRKKKQPVANMQQNSRREAGQFAPSRLCTVQMTLSIQAMNLPRSFR